jgi:hypothetical protein
MTSFKEVPFFLYETDGCALTKRFVLAKQLT